MGIDIYVKWDGQTEAEKKAQLTGFSIDAGQHGYLREAYHGGPYSTRVLVPEAFEAVEAGDDDAMIPAATLRLRLEEAVETAVARQQNIYGEVATEAHPMVRSLRAFVELVERLEREGKRPHIIASY